MINILRFRWARQNSPSSKELDPCVFSSCNYSPPQGPLHRKVWCPHPSLCFWGRDDGTEWSMFVPELMGKGETVTFTSAEPGISKAVDGNSRAAMAALFLAPTIAPCSWELLEKLLELCQVWCYNHVPGESFPAPSHLLGEEDFPNLPWQKFVFPQVLKLVAREKETNLPFPLWGSCRLVWVFPSISCSLDWINQGLCRCLHGNLISWLRRTKMEARLQLFWNLLPHYI